MKRIIYGTIGIALFFATACKKEKDSSGSSEKTLFGTEKPYINAPGSTLDTLKGAITANKTVTQNALLSGIVTVKSGVTLTINSGLTIYGSGGPNVLDPINLENNKGTLIVEPGAKLVAVGTANAPIVWTSVKKFPVTSTACDFGEWGGIVILGNAPVAAAGTGATSCSNTNIFEAFNVANWPASIVRTYGGSNAADNSGSIVYNRIEFGGGPVAAANREVNGLTLCGVGTGTFLDHIEVSGSGDDGFEFFGGTVNAKGLISFNNKDDDFDFDEGYAGKLQYIVAYRTRLADNSFSHFIESDNNPAAISCASPFGRTQAFISNASFIAAVPGTPVPASSFFDSASVQIRRNSAAVIINSILQFRNQFDRAFGFTSTTASRVASGVTLSRDSTYIAINTSEGLLSGQSALEANFPFTGPVTLPLQAPAVTTISSPFVLPGGFNPNGLGFFNATTQQGALASGYSLLGGIWISTEGTITN